MLICRQGGENTYGADGQVPDRVGVQRQSHEFSSTARGFPRRQRHARAIISCQLIKSRPCRRCHGAPPTFRKRKRRSKKDVSVISSGKLPGRRPRIVASGETDPSRRATSWNLDLRCRVEKRGIAFRAVSLTDGVEKRHLVWKDSFCWIPPFRDISHPSIARNQGVVDLCSFLAAVSTSKTTQEPLSSPPSRYDAKMI